MSRARIVNGVWVRHIPKKWQQRNGVGRTDIFKSVRADTRLRVAEFRFVGGPTVRVSKEELQRVVEVCVDHYSDRIWGPFYINPNAHTINDQSVEMEVV